MCLLSSFDQQIARMIVCCNTMILQFDKVGPITTYTEIIRFWLGR